MLSLHRPFLSLHRLCCAFQAIFYWKLHASCLWSAMACLYAYSDLIWSTLASNPIYSAFPQIIWFAFWLLLFASGIYPWLAAMLSDMSSFSTRISSPIVETFVPKTMLGTTVQLNGSNYLLRAQAFHIFIGARNKLTHLLQFPPLLQIPLMWPGLLEIILLGSSTVWRRRLVAVSVPNYC